MKKSTKLLVALLVIVAALAVTFRLMNRVPSADLEANAQMQQITVCVAHFFLFGVANVLVWSELSSGGTAKYTFI